MKELKFRVYDRLTNKIYEVVTIHFRTVFVEFQIDSGLVKRSSDKVEICQYTGMKDYSGKEIYEGDIIEYSNGMILRVGFMKGKFIGIYESIFGDEAYDILKDVKVVGNIFENYTERK